MPAEHVDCSSHAWELDVVSTGVARAFRSARRLAAVVALFCVVDAAPAVAQSEVAAAAQSASALPLLSVDETGRRLVRATRTSQPIRIDGRLDEEAYAEALAITDFIQQVPENGAPVSERTEIWLLFDDENIYISCRCWDEFPEQIVANDMRRDSSNTGSQDNLTVAFDTFNDQRNGFIFTVTASGSLRDGTTTEERSNFDWSTVFDGGASIFERGWIAEMAIPFKSLRYQPGREQIWNVQIRRRISRTNELAYITRVSPAWAQRAVHHYSEAATLVGLSAPPAARNFEIKPYAMSRMTTDRLSRPPVANDVEPDGGFDLKYGVTESLTADLTYNTDFAQVEADEAQVNLTRFSLSFPEKREFFLEGGDIFTFGASAAGDLGGDAPSVFYSRRIGLAGSRVVPVLAGGRLTGKTGPWSIGALNIETKDDEAAGVEDTNFTVLRLRRDILQRSTIGALVTNRSVSSTGPGSNQVWGADANFAFYENVFFSAYVARSTTDARSGDDLAYRAQFNYTHDRYGLALDRLVVEKNFNPEIGLLRRENFRRNLARVRFSPRTTNNRLVRQWIYEGSIDYVTDNDNRLESRELNGSFRMDLHSSDALALEYSRRFEFIPEAFSIDRTLRIGVGEYSFDNVRVAYTLGAQHRVAGTPSIEVGSFYDGEKTTAAFRGRVEVTPQLGIEPIISVNWIDLPQGRSTTSVLGGRGVYTVNPRMFVAALIQYSSSNTSLSTNLRFRWEYQPGSELFVVYTEGRSTLPERGTDLENRGLVVKINRLFRF
jgi:hypothetical protein